MLLKSPVKKANVLFVAALTLILLPSSSSGQSFSVGADFMSRYVWRGVDFGESFSIQPTLEFNAAGFALGSWASYSIAADGSDASEHDLYVSYSFGAFSIGLTDYYFPSPGGSAFFDDGAHLFELNARIGGTDSFPLTISGNVFFLNEDDNSIYIELGYPFSVEDIELGVALGIVPQESTFYGTSTAGVVVFGLSAVKEISLSDNFGLPVSVSYVLNPTPGAQRSFLIFGISL